ncbi:hypothetical protein QL996_08020 [Planococcus sp. APC 4015]|nr:hypothetical protein [Planococcus sp. APC 4015]
MGSATFSAQLLLTISVPVVGSPGATVAPTFGGSRLAAITLDAAGSGVVVLQPSLLDIVSDSSLGLRYTAGDLAGPEDGTSLSDLVSLEALLAAWEAANAPIVTPDPPVGDPGPAGTPAGGEPPVVPAAPVVAPAPVDPPAPAAEPAPGADPLPADDPVAEGEATPEPGTQSPHLGDGFP